MKLDINGNPENPTINDMPIYYTYQGKDGWKKTDKKLTDDLNRSFVMGSHKMSDKDLCGYSFYPQFREPSKDNPDDIEADGTFKKKVAWRITAEGVVVARNHWVECQHLSWHRYCKKIDDNRCQRLALLYLEWDKNLKMWVRVD